MTEHRGIRFEAAGCWSTFASFVLAAALGVAGHLRAAEVSVAEGNEFFEKRVRPLLVERCYRCHSATSEKLKGGLRLDSREGMLKGGETRPAIVPGDPEKSLLIEAVRYGNSDLQMPPKKRLTEPEVADLANWIALGAPWPGGTNSTAAVAAFDLEKRRREHWAWQPIRPPEPPAVADKAWPISLVDRFVLAKLEANHLSPAPAADKRTLIRRVYFDLIGLPPTPAEVESFLGDTSTNAFENVVDRLLARPQFGERWARHWLDLVRYAETLGHEFDYAAFNAWRYRDYVIRAFNADVPYDRFTMEQVAGDLLDPPRRHPTEGFNESVIGTGFYWLGQRVHSPVDVRLEQAEVVDNQIDVTAKTFLGLTVACARCHDHKFDAIASRDYYSLFGVFESSRYAQRSIDPPEELAGKVESLRSLKDRLRPLIGAVWQAQATNVAAYLLAAREVDSAAASIALSNRVASVATAQHLDATRLDRWVRALSDKGASQPEHPLHAWNTLAGITNGASVSAFAEAWHALQFGAPTNSSGKTESFGAELFADFSGMDFGAWSVEDEAFGAAPTPTGDFVVGDAPHPVVSVLREPAANSAAVSRRLEGVLRSPTFTINKRYAHILAAGSSGRLNVRVDNFTMIRDPIYGGLKRGLDHNSLQWMSVDLETWKGHRAYLEFNDETVPDPSEEAEKKYSEFAYVAISRVVFSDSPTPPPVLSHSVAEGWAPVQTLEQLAQQYQQATVKAVQSWATGRCLGETGSAQISLIDWLNRNGLLDAGGVASDAARKLVSVLEEFRSIERSIPERARVLGMIEGTGVDENVFIRGSHKTLGDVVPRRFLEALGGSTETRFRQGSGRLELARCITSPSNPLPARVMVNRVWHHLFGRGIVPTPDDFGVLGQPPTNPELLDWLADWFRTEGGWSTKRLIRLLVTSRTYRLSSRPADPAAEEKDPQDLWLHRMPIRRLEGEAIRDAILAVSGRLDPAMFGPPVPVYLTEFMDGRGKPARSGPLDGACRRSIYQEVRRNFLPPMMRAFDFPVPFTTIGRRTSSNVPAQSLMLMNDPFVVGEARAWAKAVLSQGDVPAERRISRMYETIFSRPPSATELADAISFLDQQGAAYGLDAARRGGDLTLWTDLCHVLMNVKEFVFLN